jgi:hypothetical protein
MSAQKHDLLLDRGLIHFPAALVCALNPERQYDARGKLTDAAKGQNATIATFTDAKSVQIQHS